MRYVYKITGSYEVNRTTGSDLAYGLGGLLGAREVNWKNGRLSFEYDAPPSKTLDLQVFSAIYGQIGERTVTIRREEPLPLAQV